MVYIAVRERKELVEMVNIFGITTEGVFYYNPGIYTSKEQTQISS